MVAFDLREDQLRRNVELRLLECTSNGPIGLLLIRHEAPPHVMQQVLDGLIAGEMLILGRARDLRDNPAAGLEVSDARQRLTDPSIWSPSLDEWRSGEHYAIMGSTKGRARLKQLVAANLTPPRRAADPAPTGAAKPTP
jgi:hypothetical protein